MLRPCGGRPLRRWCAAGAARWPAAAGGPTDEEQVRATLDRLRARDAAKDYDALCDRILAPTLIEQVEQIGLPCEVALKQGLGGVAAAADRRRRHRQRRQGDRRGTAEAERQAPSRRTRIELERTGGGWRIASLGDGGAWHASPAPEGPPPDAGAGSGAGWGTPDAGCRPPDGRLAGMSPRSASDSCSWPARSRRPSSYPGRPHAGTITWTAATRSTTRPPTARATRPARGTASRTSRRCTISDGYGITVRRRDGRPLRAARRPLRSATCPRRWSSTSATATTT